MHDKNMTRHFLFTCLGGVGTALVILVIATHVTGFMGSFSQTEPGFEYQEPLSEPMPWEDPYTNWQRPPGPLRVGIQAGHWFAQNAPDEQEGLRDNTGAEAGGVTEWETNLRIAQETKKLLEAQGVTVDLLPTTIPPDYIADAFISIHADGNADTSVNGYKIASPRRDRSGNAQHLADLIQASYGSSTKLNLDDNITRNMRGYYAFNTRRYEHSIHPMTPGVILETGFITNAKDRKVISGNPERSAQGIVTGVMNFLKETVPNTVTE